jgi:hypothetical protein
MIGFKISIVDLATLLVVIWLVVFVVRKLRKQEGLEKMVSAEGIEPSTY